ncbi:hypothetical protein [Flavobacterium sedimenticola]|uniref:BZIP transcription factor n=1 Tax=Flavobacterium sedimenticola TaxID=3043286 RepID=A0ABT6XTY6_9FLAO|nr:hypothetical protein [Flavobacterium sedimenticola]MDI9258526.1 hypothetical protein [Flavobacterium sedimenticola]
MKKNYVYLTAILFLLSVKANAQIGNTFSGEGSGTNSIGNFNTGFGFNSLLNNTSNSNSAFGRNTLSSTTGGFNCAFGNESLATNIDGSLNNAFGTRSLYANVSGKGNVALGHRSMEANVTGSFNTSIGYASSLSSVGSFNVALGAGTPRHLINGNSNIFIGYESGINLTSGNNNVFIGRVALFATPSSAKLAGNDTNNTIILADGFGNQRIFVNRNGNTGIGLGNNVIPANRLDVGGGVVIGRNFVPNASTTDQNTTLAPANGLLVEGKVGIGTKTPNNKLEITQGVTGNSGLRFTNLTSLFNPTTTTTTDKFLTVNATGDVVLQRMPGVINTNAISSNANTMTSNVSGILASAPIVNSISNTINTNNQLVTTVNGVSSAPVTLPQSLLTEVDGSTTNELQTISMSGNTISLSNGGGSVTIPSFTDTDAQTLSITGNVLSISNGNSVVLPNHGPQTITQNGAIVTLSNGGGSFTLPQTVVQAGTNVTVTGTGTAASPYIVSAAAGTDTSLYANNGIINQATTTAGNRVVDMNNSNIWFNTANSTSNGKIYLGSSTAYPNTTGNYKLFVEGGILTEKVKVALRSSANWADYVFAKDYKLMPLKEVEQFVMTNKHLPGIDSAEKLAANGIDVAEMQSKQMEKIEELTLYIIDQEKKIEAQNKAIDKNNQEIEALKAQIQLLLAKSK